MSPGTVVLPSYNDNDDGIREYATEWRFSGVAEGVNSPNSTVPDACKTTAKMVCEQIQDGLVNSVGLATCNAVGIAMERKPYSWE